jgi:hypothetical protein
MTAGMAGRYPPRAADVAQLVEHFTRNEGVRGSNPRVGFLQLARLRDTALAKADVGALLGHFFVPEVPTTADVRGGEA